MNTKKIMMNDLEISKALALAIGWNKNQLQLDDRAYPERLRAFCCPQWRVFDYRDWNVIGPIAKKYGLLVDFREYSVLRSTDIYFADTPQKAIALAVIGAKK